MQKPVCVVLHDNSLTSDPPESSDRDLSVVRLGYEHNLCYYCRMSESVSSDTAGVRALLSVITEDKRLGFSETGPIF